MKRPSDNDAGKLAADAPVSDWVAVYQREGLALIDGLLAPEQTAAAAAGVAWAMSQPMAQYKWIRQRTYEWYLRQPVFLVLIRHPGVLEFAAAILGPGYHLIAAQCSRNTRDDPYAPGAMKFHRDACFFAKPGTLAEGVALDRVGFSAMWYVQDTPLAMGPTELLRGSQINLLPVADAAAGLPCFSTAIAAGSLLLFNHQTVHRGRLNATSTPRDLITNAYARPEIGKVQLTVSPADGAAAVYQPPTELLAGNDPVLKQLLQPNA